MTNTTLSLITTLSDLGLILFDLFDVLIRGIDLFTFYFMDDLMLLFIGLGLLLLIFNILLSDTTGLY